MLVALTDGLLIQEQAQRDVAAQRLEEDKYFIHTIQISRFLAANVTAMERNGQVVQTIRQDGAVDVLKDFEKIQLINNDSQMPPACQQWWDNTVARSRQARHLESSRTPHLSYRNLQQVEIERRFSGRC